MIIDDIRTEWLRVPIHPPIADSTHVLRFMDLILVEIRAGGHSGWSYMLSFDYGSALLKGVVDHELKRYVIGCDAGDIGGIHGRNLRATEYIGNAGVAMWGTAAIDVALWDLLARRLNVPAVDLFGRRASAVPVYGSGGWISYSDEDLADEVSRYLSRGFQAVKIKIGGPSEDRDVDRIRAVRAALGPDRKLMVDANQGLTLDRALRLARRVEDCRLSWIEEPFPKDDLESYQRLTAATEIPLAAGEREFGVEPFRRIVNARALSILQPDLMRVGGVTGWRLVAGLAECNLLRVAPHFYREHDLHLSAAQPHLVAIESFDWLADLLESPFEVRDGMAVVPDRPGFGVNFREEAIQEYRFRP
ncbi:MAG TPA: mandelate racemase/muconate lactonizing enzyme family protein [Bryobacteraceae bacterium]|nr:mandelate racemase/muconate lactonizing enzyme family protein [Bryobacteraceae bacterium]